MTQPIDDPIVSRGRTRFRLFSASVQKFTNESAKGRLLDFGCGAGGFLQAAIEQGCDAYGVEVEVNRQTQFLSLIPATNHGRFTLYDGNLLPFPTGHFDLIYSWFVFEHVQRPLLSIREIARVTKVGGTIHIYADDARNHWDGHVGIPFPAFLPRCYTHPYLEVFGLQDRASFINETVVFVTAPMISSALQALGCEILYENVADPMREIPGAANIASASDARRVALEVKARVDAGLVTPPRENLHLVARRVR